MQYDKCDAKSDSRSAAHINDYQKSIYEDVEKNMADRLVARYSEAMEPLKRKGKIKILDIGGASGFFSKALHKYFSENGCEIVVIDNTRYDTWDEFGGETIKFIEDSAENIGKIFPENTFDLIFANRVFHHLVTATGWKDTVRNITDIVKQVSKVLKGDGVFCVTEHCCDGILFDASASAVIYTLTSCKLPLLARIFRRIEAKSAGVGVCYLSKKMWMTIIDNCGFMVDKIYEGHKISWNFMKRIVYGALLFIRRHRMDVTIICKKKR
ncbi:MAG: class I SAM-dependent methyltransferase [Chitinispirillales bacterium]|jgi:SAM-dependent methyltransferase|nr:class I SAM-dependent methyltransferase [Chitinispirillales bacterium]